MFRSLVALLLAGLVLVAAPPAPADAAPAVERAQRRLNQLGCKSGPVDGVMGEWTKSAIIRFQSRHRISQNGRLTAATTRRLYGDRARRCDVRPVPRHSGTGRRIVISQRQNWVWLVASGGRVVAQSGMIDSLWLDNFTRFAACGIGFHRIPRYMSNGNQIHPDWMVGTNLRQSHGCIRVPKAFSARLWDFGRIGTRVRVVRG